MPVFDPPGARAAGTNFLALNHGLRDRPYSARPRDEEGRERQTLGLLPFCRR